MENTYQLATKKEYASYIKAMFDLKRRTPLSSAALEVLAVVAYNQPVTKSFIEQVRGVDCSGVVTTLVDVMQIIGRRFPKRITRAARWASRYRLTMILTGKTKRNKTASLPDNINTAYFLSFFSVRRRSLGSPYYYTVGRGGDFNSAVSAGRFVCFI